MKANQKFYQLLEFYKPIFQFIKKLFFQKKYTIKFCLHFRFLKQFCIKLIAIDIDIELVLHWKHNQKHQQYLN